jgi:hypothetical protein
VPRRVSQDASEAVLTPTAVSRPGKPRPVASRSLNAATLVIADERGPAEPVTVDLMGVLYDVTPPKSALAMRIAWLAAERDSDPDEVFQALEAWMDKAFGDQADSVRHRMYEDDKDPLDFPHIMALIQKLIELSSDLPTTPR